MFDRGVNDIINRNISLYHSAKTALYHHGAIINHSLDSEVIGSQFSIIDL